MRRSYEFAQVQLTRLSQHRRSAYPRRFSVLRPDGDASASPEEAPLGCTNCGENVGTYGITSVLRIWQSGGCGSAYDLLRTVCAPVRHDKQD